MWHQHMDTPHPPPPGYPCTATDICQCHTPLSLGRTRHDTRGDCFTSEMHALLNSKGGWEHLGCCFNIHINLVLVLQEEYKMYTLRYGLYTWKIFV